ncbi:MAG: DUF6913 domain-containing protein [Dysgonomonas sp.]
MFSFIAIKNKISSALINNKRRHAFLKLDDIQKVLILFTYKDWDDVHEIVKDLESKGKSVELWTTYSQRNAKEDVSVPAKRVRVITPKEISRWWGVSSSTVEEFGRLEYDTLLDLTTKKDKSILYLLARNSAKFCIGIKEPEHKFFDFILLKEDDANLQETYIHIKNYLNNMC